MALVDNGSGLSAADIAAVMGNNGNGFGFGGDGGAWWLLVLFLFAFSGNAWNNGFGGNGGSGSGVTYIQSDVQRGFDQSAVMSGISGINSAVATGFANAEVSRCNSQANILQTLNTNQAATIAGMNTLASSLQNCCCENRTGIADLKYTIATENCADRTALQQSTSDIIASQTAGTQKLLDKLCQLEMDGIKQNYENQLTTLRTQNSQLLADLNTARFNESQAAQTASILANNEAQTTALEQYLAPTPRPAYVVQNPNCCAPTYFNGGCGCGVA